MLIEELDDTEFGKLLRLGMNDMKKNLHKQSLKSNLQFWVLYKGINILVNHGQYVKIQGEK